MRKKNEDLEEKKNEVLEVRFRLRWRDDVRWWCDDVIWSLDNDR